MTTPAITDKLGDFTQVQLNPNLPVPILSGISGLTVTIANQDLTQTITIARRNNFVQNGPNTATIPPLGSITVDASRTIWGLAPTNTLPPLIFPGGGNWAPSPAQVAAQINALGLAKDTSVNNPSYGPATLTAQNNQNTTIPLNISTTGVPLLTKSTVVSSNSAFVVTSGTAQTFGPFTMTQVGYELSLTTFQATNLASQARIVVQWIDSASSTVVDQQSWWFLPGADSTTNLHSISGTGPVVADQIQIKFYAFTNNVSFSYILRQISVVYPRHDFRTIGMNNLAGALAAATFDMSGMILVQNGAAVVTGGHYTLYAPLFSGQVTVWGHTSSNAADAVMNLNPIADQVATGGTNILATDSTGNFNINIFIPRSQIQFVFTNNNAATKTLNMNVTMADK